MPFKFIPAAIKTAFRNAVKKRYGFKENMENYNHFRSRFFDERRALENGIPKTDLQQKHIDNLKVLLNRTELLKQIPEYGIGAEIGVAEGYFSEEIIKIAKPKKLHLIDAWGDAARYHDGLKLDIKVKFDAAIKDDKIEVNVGYSTDVLKIFPDNYFDWVYLDTNHTYKTTAEELAILHHKMKPTGIISGHDYIIGNWSGDCRYGVIEAVHEFCVDENWELLYITINKDEMPSFAIRKITNR